MSAFHAIYGLLLESSVALPGLVLAPWSGEPDIRIHLREPGSPIRFAPQFAPNEIVFTSPETNERGEPMLQVGKLAGGNFVGFWYGDGAKFAVDRDGREIWADWTDRSTLEDACVYLVGPVMAFAIRLRGVTCLHASAVAVDGRAMALLGGPGAGKSTTAAAFALAGFAVLSDDVVVLREREGGLFVQPGYPRVNLWPESVRLLLGNPGALPRITPTWEKQYLPLDRNERRFAPGPLPLGAIYFLDDREPGLAAPVVEEFFGSRMFLSLVAHAYVNYLLDGEMLGRDFDICRRLIGSVPVRRVRRPADSPRLAELCDAIAADARQLAVRQLPEGMPVGR